MGKKKPAKTSSVEGVLSQSAPKRSITRDKYGAVVRDMDDVCKAMARLVPPQILADVCFFAERDCRSQSERKQGQDKVEASVEQMSLELSKWFSYLPAYLVFPPYFDEEVPEGTVIERLRHDEKVNKRHIWDHFVSNLGELIQEAYDSVLDEPQS
jgi:hypothetical protein